MLVKPALLVRAKRTPQSCQCAAKLDTTAHLVQCMTSNILVQVEPTHSLTALQMPPNVTIVLLVTSVHRVLTDHTYVQMGITVQ